MLELKPIAKLGEEYTGGLSYSKRTTEIIYACCRELMFEILPQKILEAAHKAGREEEEAQGPLGNLSMGSQSVEQCGQPRDLQRGWME